jgi:hypothetical protein
MAEEQEEEHEDDESEYDEESEYESEDDEEVENYALRGLRFFTNNLNGEQHDQEDIENEQTEEEEHQEQEDDRAVVPKLAPYLITQKLMEQGVNMEQLVKVLLLEHNEYEREDEEFTRISDEMFGKLRIIISNNRPSALIHRPN